MVCVTTKGAQYAAFGKIFGSLAYWRLTPASFFVHGGFMALQGLWIALWWVNVNGLSRTEAAHWLFALNGVVLVAFFLLGVYVGAIERAGVLPARPAVLSGTAAAMPLFSPPDRIPWRFG